MDDWGGIAIRFAVYATLGLMFGMPLQALAMPAAPDRRAGWIVLVLAAIGCSAIGLLALTAAMSGGALVPPDRETLSIIVFDTAMGTAFLIRFAALAAALVATCWPRLDGWTRLRALVPSGGVALATLAWTGHGAMDEGARGWGHLAADIVHLLAAGAWLGAIAAMLAALARPSALAGCEALERFARTGSVLVALLLATGLVNGAMILGIDALPRIGVTLYGRLLLVKFALFAAMLAMAALNRWRLTPRLKAAIAAGDTGRPLAALRVSLSVEIAFGLAILALVGWLGATSPDA